MAPKKPESHDERSDRHARNWGDAVKECDAMFNGKGWRDAAGRLWFNLTNPGESDVRGSSAARQACIVQRAYDKDDKTDPSPRR